ncbi:MAG TPA: M20/M25/M40 family metallo-hydrolase [Mucilaginibacter sp.]|nr:M20/M25/M40 family metallo-hydrolase [Mucilaginibacter sp.]
MKNYYFKSILTVLLLAGANLYAQENVDTAAFGRIRRAEMTNSHIPTIAHYITDVAGPRLTNSPGYKRAGTWAVETMKKWGMVNTAMEPWGDFGKGWEIQDFSISLRAPYSQSITAYPEPWTGNTPGEIHGEVVVLPSAHSMDTAYIIKHAAEFKGKFVLVAGNPPSYDEDFKPSAERLADTALANMKDTYMLSRAVLEGYLKYFKTIARVPELIKDAGALAIITSGNQNRNGTVFVQGLIGYKTNSEQSVVKVAIASEDAQRIKRLLASGQKVELNLNVQGKFYDDDIKGYNVVGEIPGTDPKLKSQLVMLGGHMDAWASSTGATDNGAGCIVMLEAVRLLDSLGLKPKRTIRLALWGGEEQGLLGSYGYVKNHFRGADMKLKPEAAKVSAYFNLDNGTGKIRGIFAQGNTAIKPIFEEWFKPFADLGASTVTLSNTGSTDHLSFDWAGIPGFQFIQDPIDYETRTHHSNMDNYDHLKIDDLKQAAIIVASFVYQTATRPDMLPRKPLENGTFVFDGL